MPQITKFGKFVDYWMSRFDKLNDDRIFVSYETLTDDNDGPSEAIRITNFLARSEGVDPIAVESVPCVWRAVVKYKEQLSDSQKDNERRRLDPSHHDSQRSGPTERPYTPELLDAMSKMLLDLIQKWGDRHLRLRKTLEGYLQVVQAASGGLSSPAKSFHIFQASPPNTGSTVLRNLLVGLFDPDADYKQSSVVSKTHETDLLGLYKEKRKDYDEVFFVASNRGTDRVAKEVCEYNNVLCIEYEELVYNNAEEMHAMVNTLANKLQSRFEYFFGPGKLDDSKRMDAVKRIESMDNAVAALGDQPPVGSDALQASPQHGSRGTLFYCGGAQRYAGQDRFKYSTFGLFLAKSLFPDFQVSIEVSGNIVETTAVALTDETMRGAARNDLLIVHSHQHCEASVESFPGIQLHINVRCCAVMCFFPFLICAHVCYCHIF